MCLVADGDCSSVSPSDYVLVVNWGSGLVELVYGAAGGVADADPEA